MYVLAGPPRRVVTPLLNFCKRVEDRFRRVAPRHKSEKQPATIAMPYIPTPLSAFTNPCSEGVSALAEELVSRSRSRLSSCKTSRDMHAEDVRGIDAECYRLLLHSVRYVTFSNILARAVFAASLDAFKGQQIFLVAWHRKERLMKVRLRKKSLGLSLLRRKSRWQSLTLATMDGQSFRLPCCSSE